MTYAVGLLMLKFLVMHSCLTERSISSKIYLKFSVNIPAMDLC